MEHLEGNVQRAERAVRAAVTAVGCDWAHYTTSDRPVEEEAGCFQPAEGTSAYTGEVGTPHSLPTHPGALIVPPQLSSHTCITHVDASGLPASPRGVRDRRAGRYAL
jgi:hypothetical protein